MPVAWGRAVPEEGESVLPCLENSWIPAPGLGVGQAGREQGGHNAIQQVTKPRRDKGPPQQAAMAVRGQSRAQSGTGADLSTCSWLPSPGVVPELLCPPTYRCLSDLLRAQLHGSGIEPTGRTLCGACLGWNPYARQQWVQELPANLAQLPGVREGMSGGCRLQVHVSFCARSGSAPEDQVALSYWARDPVPGAGEGQGSLVGFPAWFTDLTR